MAASQSANWSQGQAGKSGARAGTDLTSKMRQLNNLIQDGQNVQPPQWGRNGLHDGANVDHRERGNVPKGGSGYAGCRGKGSQSDEHDHMASPEAQSAKK